MYNLMYKLSFVFLFFCLSLSLSAQSSQYAVEVGAFANKVPLSYFKKLNQKVYETLDVNEIYRYYIDVSDENRGKIVRAEAKAAGYNYARVIDFEYQRQLCANQCGYTPPTPTDPSNRITPPRPTKRGQITDTYETLQKEDSLLRLKWVFFDFDKSNITPKAKTELEKVAEVLQKYPNYSVELYAHTDAKGSIEYNERLSARRAEAAKKELLRLGVPSSSISSREFGKGSPIAANEINNYDTPEGREFNRRVEIQIFDRQGNIVNIVDETQIPNNLRIGQNNSSTNNQYSPNNNQNNSSSNNQYTPNNNQNTYPNNNSSTYQNPKPAAKPKRKKAVNNHYDK